MLGIVILNYQKWDETLECVNSIISNKISEDVSICIVDNNSTTPMPEKLQEAIDQNDNIMLLRLNNNYGYAYGNNRGYEYLIRIKVLDYVIISNSDIVFYPDSLQRIVDFYRSGGEGITFPKIISPNGTVSYLDAKYYTNMNQMYFRVFKKKSYYSRDNAINMNSSIPIQTHLQMGACFAFDRKAMTTLMPLDEKTTLYFEEMILSRKADEKGIPIYYVPQSEVLHKEGKSTGSGNPFAEMCRDESMLYYSRTYIRANRFLTFPLYIVLLGKYSIKTVRKKSYRRYFLLYCKRLTAKWIGK